MRPGPTPRATPISASAIVLSAVGHLGLLTAAAVAATLWQAEQPKVYVVNLVPAVAAIGSPAGPAHATPQAPARTEPVSRPKSERAPLAKTEVAEARSSPELPDLPRETARRPSLRESPELPDASSRREISLPAARQGLKVPPLPSERPALRPPDQDRALPSRLADVGRDRPPRPVKLAPIDDAVGRRMPRGVPEVARRSATPPAPLAPPPIAPDLPQPIASASPRQVALPQAGKELPSLAAPPPEPIAPTPARPAPTTAKVAPPVAAPTGSVALGHPAGSMQGSGPVTVQASDFPFAWYLRAVQRKITEKWAPPVHGDGRALVVFEIGRNGEVKAATLEGSSGDAVYDQAALRAIADATPFPPLPEQYKSSTLKIHLGFSLISDRG